jgi:hypothetical protein
MPGALLDVRRVRQRDSGGILPPTIASFGFFVSWLCVLANPNVLLEQIAKTWRGQPL